MWWCFSRDSAFFKRVNVSAVALIRSRNYICIVGTEDVFGSVSDTSKILLYLKYVAMRFIPS